MPLSRDAPAESPAGNAALRLGDQAYAALEELIVTAALPPGSLWSEAALSERTGIGRTPVREALQRLAADHLVVLLRRHGIKITEVQVSEQLLVLDARRELERLVSVWAARRSTRAEREAHLGSAVELREAGAKRDPLLYLRVHFALKRFTCECARNPYAARALSPLHALSRRFFYVHHDRFGDLMEVARVHADLAEAIGRGDEAAASARCDAMTDYAVAFTRKIILE
ncbi:transcriptional regulator, GntR family [Methylobacterium sp. 4-46]|uniref:GntR family transcriptional regulator n=1 Tax=unclassified Methylobacterium TaxID=2615210 RepID=UPI000165C5E0|nr:MULTISPECIES: GntR family transcriptional regulator [Methylobacterium]ACA15850.1 transcriptional regulator, GntR family [Methylobacterium sp. 4-46]WFT81578.1 GntR family transcriptional regulator [Methylobacterium nodulans]